MGARQGRVAIRQDCQHWRRSRPEAGGALRSGALGAGPEAWLRMGALQSEGLGGCPSGLSTLEAEPGGAAGGLGLGWVPAERVPGGVAWLGPGLVGWPGAGTAWGLERSGGVAGPEAGRGPWPPRGLGPWLGGQGHQRRWGGWVPRAASSICSWGPCPLGLATPYHGACCLAGCPGLVGNPQSGRVPACRQHGGWQNSFCWLSPHYSITWKCSSRARKQIWGKAEARTQICVAPAGGVVVICFRTLEICFHKT